MPYGQEAYTQGDTSGAYELPEWGTVLVTCTQPLLTQHASRTDVLWPSIEDSRAIGSLPVLN